MKKQDDIFAKRDSKKVPLLQRKSWNVSAVLTLVIYGVCLVAIYTHIGESHEIENIVHILPLIAAAMFVIGYFEKRRKEEEDAVRKSKRYQARMTLNRINREDAQSQPRPGAKKEGP